MPTRLQASISSVPAGAVTFLPSTVMFTSAIKILVGHLSLIAGKNRQGGPYPDDQRLATRPLALPPFQTGRVCRPNDLQILFGTSSQRRSSASLPHRQADKMSAPACFPKGTECYRCLSSPQHQRGSA